MDESHATISSLNEKYYFKSLVHNLESKLDRIENSMISLNETIRSLSARQHELLDRVNLLEQAVIQNDIDTVISLDLNTDSSCIKTCINM